MTRMIKSKKAVWFPVLLVIMTLTTLSYAAWVLNEKAKPFTDAIGERQFNIIKTYDEAEKHLLYIDQAAKFSSSQSIYEQALKGGYHLLPTCSEYRGFTLWSNGSENCYPNQFIIKNNLGNTITNALNLYFDKYSVDLKNKDKSNWYPTVIIPQNNYDFLITNEEEKTKISGYAAKNIVLNISSEDEEQPIGFYSIKPSFKTETAFSLDIYNEAIEKTKQLISECKTQSNVKDCVEDEIKDINKAEELLSKYEWSLDCEHEAEKAFYELVDKFEECQNQENSFCYCSNYPIDRFDSEPLKDYTLKITQNDENTLIELYHKKRFTGLSRTFKNNLYYFYDYDHTQKVENDDFTISKGINSEFWFYNSDREKAVYIARDNNNIGFIRFFPNPNMMRTPGCLAETEIIIDSPDISYKDAKTLSSLIIGKAGKTHFIGDDDIGNIGRKTGLDALAELDTSKSYVYILLNGIRDHEKKLLINYNHQGEDIAKKLKFLLSEDIIFKNFETILPPTPITSLLIDRSNLERHPSISLEYPLEYFIPYRPGEQARLINLIFKSIKDYLPQDSEQANFKLCVNTKSQLLTYNQVTDQVENNDIIIRFGLKIE